MSQSPLTELTQPIMNSLQWCLWSGIPWAVWYNYFLIRCTDVAINQRSSADQSNRIHGLINMDPSIKIIKLEIIPIHCRILSSVVHGIQLGINQCGGQLYRKCQFQMLISGAFASITLTSSGWSVLSHIGILVPPIKVGANQHPREYWISAQYDENTNLPDKDNSDTPIPAVRSSGAENALVKPGDLWTASASPILPLIWAS